MAHEPENCKEVFALLSQYLDLELPPGECAEIEEHLADCPPCVEFMESLRKSVELCRESRPGVMPPPLTAKARAELKRAWKKAQGKKMKAGRTARG